MLKRNYLQLFVVSFLLLFLELLLIRLISTEIRIFAYLSNVILISIFVGTGLGLLIKRKIPLYFSALSLFFLEVILVTQYIFRLPSLEFKLFSGITELLAPLSESYIWLQSDTYSKTGVLIGLILAIFLLLLISFIFVALGNYLGQLFNSGKRPVLLYSVNIFASLLGMWAFQGSSLLGVSPYLGLLFCQLLIVFLFQENFSKIISVSALLGALVLLIPRQAYQPYEKPVTYWSPYQKLTLSLINGQKPYQAGGWYLEVNNVGYMGLLDLSDKTFQKREPAINEFFGNNLLDLKFANQYTLPYKIKKDPENVLIIGGGAGNDAAAALRSNVKNIDLVEIDPSVLAIGQKYHPEKPYQDPRVITFINDGRAFLEATKKNYQVIIMSLADSHTTSSSLSNVQLDNYLYTRESLKKARERLTNDGVLFLTFEVTRPWIGGRIEKTITDAFGFKPEIVDIRSDNVFGWGGVMFIAPKNQGLFESIQKDNELSAYLAKNSKDYSAYSTNLLRDNWPYIYLDKPRIPTLHAIVALISLLGLFVLRAKIVKSAKFNVPFFFLGGGFMLFEVQNITKSALIFGNTWVTNLFIISGVLLFLLAANLAVAKRIISTKTSFILLFLAFLLQIFVPVNFFNKLGFAEKILAAVPFLTLPHFFSGIVFTSLFERDKERSALFGSNLIGSGLGGFIAISSYLFGLSSLLYTTIFFYALGFIFALKKYNLK